MHKSTLPLQHHLMSGAPRPSCVISDLATIKAAKALTVMPTGAVLSRELGDQVPDAAVPLPTSSEDTMLWYELWRRFAGLIAAEALTSMFIDAMLLHELKPALSHQAAGVALMTSSEDTVLWREPRQIFALLQPQ
jgi:hypothetical protein